MNILIRIYRKLRYGYLSNVLAAYWKEKYGWTPGHYIAMGEQGLLPKDEQVLFDKVRETK